MKKFLIAGGIVAATLAGGLTTVAARDPRPPKPPKAAEWAADCVYAAMSSGAYTGTSADLGRFCVEAITVVVNADYRLQPE